MVDIFEPFAHDAFLRQRVSEPRNLFDHKQVVDNGTPLFFVHDVTGAGAAIAYDQPNARSVLTCGTTAAGRATRQTKRYFNYQSGKSLLIAMTFNMNGAEANCEKRVGYFDNANGIYLALPASGDPELHIRTGSSIGSQVVARAGWNGDPLDGTGASGVVLDLTKAQILVIDLQWLGVGQVRVGFYFGDRIVYAHRFAHGNIVTGVYTSTPNLPLRWEIVGTGVNPASPTLDAICGSIISEGGQEPIGSARGASRATPVAIAGGATAALISIRLKATYNRAPVFPTALFAAATSATARGIVELVLNPTLGGVPVWVPQTDSAIEVDIAATTAVGGHIISTSAVASDAGGVQFSFFDEPAISLASDYAGTVVDHLTLRITSINNDSWVAAINWRELL
jgi:hypothetical protein